MEKIKIFIVENEWATAEDLITKINKLGFESMGYVTTGEEAIEKCKKDTPDVIFMDIHLDSDMSGIDAVVELNKFCDVAIIFLTDFTDKAIFRKALKTGPANYISKPISLDDLDRSVYLALDQKGKRVLREEETTASDKEYDFVYVKDNDSLKTKVMIDNILYIEASGPYSYIYHMEGSTIRKHIVSDNSTSVSNLLPPHFQRVHRSYVVNMRKIDSIQGRTLYIKDRSIPVGEKYKSTLSAFTIIK